MSTVTDHYETVLADHYTEMFGDFEAKVVEQEALFGRLGLATPGVAKAIDLGCGSGFQSVALARLGYRVRAVDLSAKLLAELGNRKGDLPIEVVRGDIRAVADLAEPDTDIAVCMGDTLPHLESKADVERMFAAVRERLAPGGRLVLTFRDLTEELEGLDRFILLRASGDAIMTCFLEYEPDTVKVHDLIHVRDAEDWTLKKSFYRKLRLDPGWVKERLVDAGFVLDHEDDAGLVTLLARKAG
ncbi:MAG: class I SAM-dependent methyltransferase [Alphaproteobacteria bacterium]